MSSKPRNGRGALMSQIIEDETHESVDNGSEAMASSPPAKKQKAKKVFFFCIVNLLFFLHLMSAGGKKLPLPLVPITGCNFSSREKANTAC